MFDQVLGGLGDFVGGLFGNGDREEAMRLLDQARQQYAGIDPSITAQTVNRSAFLDADPSSRAAQMDVLSRLRDIASQGGLDAISKARLAEVQAQNAQAANASQASALQNAARRGTLNGSNAIVSQQLAAQGANQRNAMQGMEAAAIGEQNRNAALSGAGSLAGSIRGQDYDRAAALDAINRFNAQQRQGAAQSTVNNQFNRAGGIAGAYGAMAGQKNEDAQRTQRMWGGLGRMAGGAVDAADPGGPSGIVP